MRGGPGGSKRGASHSGPLRSGTRAEQGTGLRMKRRVHEARVPASCWGPGVRVLRFGDRSVIVIATVWVGPSGERTAVAEGSRAGSVIRGHPQICERSSGNQHRLLWGPGTGRSGELFPPGGPKGRQKGMWRWRGRGEGTDCRTPQPFLPPSPPIGQTQLEGK